MISDDELVSSYGFIDPVKNSDLCDDYKVDAVKVLIPKYCDYLTVNSKKFPYNHTALAEEMLYAIFSLVYTDEVPLAEKIRLQL